MNSNNHLISLFNRHRTNQIPFQHNTMLRNNQMFQAGMTNNNSAEVMRMKEMQVDRWEKHIGRIRAGD